MLTLHQSYEVQASILEYLKSTYGFLERAVAEAFECFVTDEQNTSWNMIWRGTGSLCFLQPSQKDHDKGEMALIYVAMTRAIHVLQVSGVGERCELLKFQTL